MIHYSQLEHDFRDKFNNYETCFYIHVHAKYNFNTAE